MLRIKDTANLNISGNAATATKLASARTIALTGSVTGSGTFDGSGNLSIATTTNHTHNYLPLSGGVLTGQTSILFTPNNSSAMLRLHTSMDSNGIGDGNTHIGYKETTGFYSHYFRGKGTTYINTSKGCEVSSDLIVKKNIYGGPAIYLGDEGNGDYKALLVRRYINSVQYISKFGASYVNNVKDLSDSSAITRYGAAIGVEHNAGTNTVLVTENSIIPGWDNGSYCGVSSHRWVAIHASTGTVYSSSKDEKENVVPLNIATANSKFTNVANIIRNGIKNTNMYSYNYKVLSNKDTYIGFIGQELKEQDPMFFNLIGNAYETEDNKTQYDIRESSVIGVLWAGLQSALQEIDEMKEQISSLCAKLDESGVN